MAEQHTDHHHTADVKEVEEEPQSTNMDYVSRFDECKHEDTGIVKQQLSEDSASSSTNRETNNDNGGVMELPDIKNGGSAEERTVSLTEGSSPPEDDNTLNMKENSSALQADEGSHGDYNRATFRKEQRTVTAEEISRVYHAGENRAPEATTPPTLGDRNNDSVDGPDEGTPDINNTNSEAGEGDRSGPEKEEKDVEENTTSSQTKGDVETLETLEILETLETLEILETSETSETTETIETIGPTTQDTADPEPAALVVTGYYGGSRVYLVAGILGFILAILGQHLFQPDSPPQKDDVRQIDIFLRQLEKAKTQFPNQRDELWTRSKIHLLRHLQTAQPTEPVSLILTAGHRAERTLHCLAQSLASAFSSSLNASVLHIDGASKASQDSDQVKLDIDSKLQSAFEGDKPVAVINRFEELPPGSTLIFYRYCDHENAAYKKTCLIFTVLLGDEEEIPAGTRLSAVEEMVDDHLQKKFLSSGHPVSFDRMDLDKYGGLWSRISHLILPVTVEESMEHGGC